MIGGALASFFAFMFKVGLFALGYCQLTAEAGIAGALVLWIVAGTMFCGWSWLARDSF
jgi:hypothetical protein